MAEEKKKIGKVNDVVSEDRNWVLRINGQLGSQKKWDSQWGYLSGGFSPQKTNIKPSINDKIKELEEQVEEMGTKDLYQTTNNNYGNGDKVQMFNNSKNNIKQNKDLRALERRLPKNWKKGKFTPPVDPFDPLSNMGKKKK